jgi:hypothetical protein
MQVRVYSNSFQGGDNARGYGIRYTVEICIKYLEAQA